MILPSFSLILLTSYVFLNNSMKTIIAFLKHMGDLGIDSEPVTLEGSFGELGEDEVVVRRVYGTGVCHVPVPIEDNKSSLTIDTYLLIGTGLGSVDTLN